MNENVIIGWTDYKIKPPDKEGVYEWQVPNKYIKTLIVQFQAKMRLRGAGYRQIISPEFDHWDGYNVIVPMNTFWRNVETIDKNIVIVEAEKILPCPFCNRIPCLEGMEYNRCATVGARPNDFNRWWMKCCEWTNTPHVDDPKALISLRNKKLKSFKYANE